MAILAEKWHKRDILLTYLRFDQNVGTSVIEPRQIVF